ncbi:hypothetical protein F4781DRAFT_381920 [Annulohypoxylon bovei var. microspora]|nr:hypothetical protein F4781DRAFT_381920 [Annulohypoxylon bovei var. microspora]
MPDPLSVAGTAVGVASLGIQVCQSLISYWRSIEGRKQEITDGLREVQTLLSVFHSLNEILPQIDQRRSNDSHAIRECLKDSEKVYQELEQLLIELRGSSTSSKIKGKMKDTGRSVVYPFRREKLTSLRQTLQGLLNNLHLAVSITSMKSRAEQETSIDTIKNDIESLRDASHIHNHGVRDVYSQIRDNADHIQSLRNNTTDILDAIEHRLDRTEWSVKDLDQNMDTKLTLMQTNITSNMLTVDTFTKLMNEYRSEIAGIARMNVQVSQIANQSSNGGKHSPMGSKSSSPPSNCTLGPAVNHGTMTREAAPRTVANRKKVSPPICNCPLTSSSATSSYTFYGVIFQFNHRIPSTHHQNCKFYGINQKAERTTEVQFPFKMGWLFANITRACIVYQTGNNHPGISVRFKNIVQRKDSPVHQEIETLHEWIILNRRNNIQCDELLSRINGFERAVLSMYKEGKASPGDRDEWGTTHVSNFIQEILTASLSRVLCYDLVTTALVDLIRTLTGFAQADNELIEISFLISKWSFFRFTKTWTNSQRMMSCLVGAFEIDPRTISNYINRFGGVGVTKIFEDFPDLADALKMEISPIAHAILSGSLGSLETHISHDPKAPMEDTFGVTTLQLCAPWPQGLRLLLATEAKSLIDIDKGQPIGLPVMVAIRADCAESVDILMKAGCQWDMLKRPVVWNGAAGPTIASNIANRRWLLLRLAEQELGFSQRASPSCVPDSIAARLCEDLDDAGISIPSFLRVPRSYTSIYHYLEFPDVLFPVYFEQGFQDCSLRNDVGLTPIMIWRDICWPNIHTGRVSLSWLCEHGFLDQKPEDPLKLGLNLHATSWHYIACMFTDPFFGHSRSRDFINEVSRVAIRDDCACWCRPYSNGCSPLVSLWKAYAGNRTMWGMQGRSEFMRHIFLHDGNMFSPEEDNVSALSLLLEFLRFLTFEALDMKHTCCVLSQVDLSKRHCHEIQLDDCGRPESNAPIVLANRDPETVKKIRSDDSEQRNARLLESLMEEFTGELERMGPSPKVLEHFLWGYWRRRMSELYSVNTDVVGEMGRLVENVQTHVLPESVLRFLGYDFDLLRFDIDRDNDDDGSSVEDIHLSLPCRYCDDN